MLFQGVSYFVIIILMCFQCDKFVGFPNCNINFISFDLSIYTLEDGSKAEPNIFLLNCTYAHPCPHIHDLCPPMPTHSMTCAHPCSSMLFKLRPCIQKLCNVYYPPTPRLGWIGQIKGRSLLLASPGVLLGQPIPCIREV